MGKAAESVESAGDAFVNPKLRQGILPGILAALIEARKATRRLLAEASDPARAAVLDSRQKALKITANALYGFTGMLFLCETLPWTICPLCIGPPSYIIQSYFVSVIYRASNTSCSHRPSNTHLPLTSPVEGNTEISTHCLKPFPRVKLASSCCCIYRQRLAKESIPVF